MPHPDDLHAAETPSSPPAMELLGGTESVQPSRPSLVARLTRGALFAVALLAATSLLAISAVPELARYMSFIPGDQAPQSCSLSSGNCTALSFASLENLEGSPCCPLQAAMAQQTGCSTSLDETLASIAADLPGCCQKSASCCEEDSACPLTLAEASADTPADEQPQDEEALANLPAAEDLAPQND